MIYINKYINNKWYLCLGGVFVFILFVMFMSFPGGEKEEKLITSKLNAKVINVQKDKLTVKDENDIIYTFSSTTNDVKAGSEVVIEYTGLLDKIKEVQSGTLVGITPVSSDEFSRARRNGGMFSDFDTLTSNKLKSMTLDEKIGQILLVRYPGDALASEVLEKYKVGGFVFFENDFKDKSKQEVMKMIKDAQDSSKIPLLTAVDEEGGSVVRVSSNPNLADSKFLSPSELYKTGGFDLIKKDTIDKSELLNELGLNVNLAPVVDVSINASDYMYDRALQEGQNLTSEYAETVIEASKGKGVSYVLKHFPGYGNNADTHSGTVLDNRTFESIETNDLPPFEAGIAKGAEAVLVSHNTVVNIDDVNPASLSPSVHNLLRNNLNFTGVIITDDLSMGAVSSIPNAVQKALLAGNDIIMVTDYEKSFNELKEAVENGTISEDLLDDANYRIISWKYYKGLMYNK